MTVPMAPPSMEKFFTLNSKQDGLRFLKLLTEFGPTDHKNRYLHWDEMRYKEPPENFNVEEHWFGTKLARSKLLSPLPLLDKTQKEFQFGRPDCVLRMLHELDQNASGRIRMAEPIANSNTRDTYLINSLMEEAISSSQLEGAVTTRQVAKEMIRKNRAPRNRSEQMIFNNYHAMQFVREHKDKKLKPAMIYGLHRIVTEKTLDEPKDAGKLRTSDDVHVVDTQGTVLHIPPKAEELKHRIKVLCDFANKDSPVAFVHPVIKGILLHFMLAYDHPFVDGNGRTARVLFYWYMARHKYWLIEFISISRILKKAHAQYGRSFLFTETDDNDTTYFIIHQLEVIQRAIKELHTYLTRKIDHLKSASLLLERTKLEGVLNHRQLAVLEDALKNPNAIYSIKEHRNIHGVTYQTARMDLLTMSDKLRLLQKLKDGRTFIFMSPPDLRQRLQAAK